MSELPVIFVAHGAPTLALDKKKGADLSRWSSEIPKPAAILVISAHWEQSPGLTGIEATSGLIYDFYGFPPELYRLQYPAPGAPDLAEDVRALLTEQGLDSGSDPDRGWDHGVWVPLMHMYPDADVPVLQLSLPGDAGAQTIYEMGKALAPLRNLGVLIMASGVLVHNLSTIDYREGQPVPAWARAFDDWVTEALESGNHDVLIRYEDQAPDFRQSHPTPEHFTPLLVAAGAASIDQLVVRFPVTGFEFGSLSRRGVQFG